MTAGMYATFIPRVRPLATAARGTGETYSTGSNVPRCSSALGVYCTNAESEARRSTPTIFAFAASMRTYCTAGGATFREGLRRIVNGPADIIAFPTNRR